MSYRVNREKNSDDAKKNTALATANSNKNHFHILHGSALTQIR